jgi:hypothetical protein
MRLSRFPGLLAILTALAASAAFAQNGGQDELWEITMSVQSDGMSMPAMTQKACTPKGKREERVPMEKNCRTLESKQSGNRSIFKFECVEGADRYTGTGEIEDLGKDAYRGFMNSSGTRDGEKFSMRVDMSGKRAGNCTWEDPAKRVAAIENRMKADQAAMCDDLVARLDSGMVFGGAGVAPEAVLCRDRQAAFCARAAGELKGIRDRARWDAAQDQYGGDRFESACKLCKLDVAATIGPLCSDAIAKGDWYWVKNHCPEAATLREQHCAGRDMSYMDPKYVPMCTVLGGTKPGGIKSRTAADGKPADPAKKPSLTDKLKEGADTLKKFLKF